MAATSAFAQGPAVRGRRRDDVVVEAEGHAQELPDFDPPVGHRRFLGDASYRDEGTCRRR